MLFLAPPRPAGELLDRYAELARTETARGVDPEFERVALIRSTADLDGLADPYVDYLALVLRHYAGPSA
ncbi:hypothetical protein ACWEN3_45130 [Streptomyces sp. NPDC004561]